MLFHQENPALRGPQDYSPGMKCVKKSLMIWPILQDPISWGMIESWPRADGLGKHNIATRKLKDLQILQSTKNRQVNSDLQIWRNLLYAQILCQAYNPKTCNFLQIITMLDSRYWLEMPMARKHCSIHFIVTYPVGKTSM